MVGLGVIAVLLLCSSNFKIDGKLDCKTSAARPGVHHKLALVLLYNNVVANV